MYDADLALTMPAQSVEEELAELAALVEEAERLGFDPWPPEKPDRPWAKWALGSFMIIMMLSAVSKVMFRFVSTQDRDSMPAQLLQSLRVSRAAPKSATIPTTAPKPGVRIGFSSE